MTSAYPTPVESLIPQAQRLAAELGQIPSRNRLMTQFRIGATKATRVRAALTAPDTDPTGQARGRLHAVPASTHPGGTVAADADPDRPVMTEATRADSSPPPPIVTEPDRPGSVTHPGQVATPADPAPLPRLAARVGWAWRVPRSWPLILLALPAFVAIWSGWVGLGELTGFGPVHPLPGIAAGFTLNTAITLPIGVETYAAYALRVWLGGIGSPRARVFARNSAIGSLVLGAAGQVAYHLMTAWHMTAAPWPITTAVACLPVLVLGFGAALAHLQHTTGQTGQEVSR